MKSAGRNLKCGILSLQAALTARGRLMSSATLEYRIHWGWKNGGGIGEIEALCISMSYCSTLFCTLERNLIKNMKKNVGLVNLKRNSISHIESSKIIIGGLGKISKTNDRGRLFGTQRCTHWAEGAEIWNRCKLSDPLGVYCSMRPCWK